MWTSYKQGQANCQNWYQVAVTRHKHSRDGQDKWKQLQKKIKNLIRLPKPTSTELKPKKMFPHSDKNKFVGLAFKQVFNYFIQVTSSYVFLNLTSGA